MYSPLACDLRHGDVVMAFFLGGGAGAQSSIFVVFLQLFLEALPTPAPGAVLGSEQSSAVFSPGLASDVLSYMEGSRFPLPFPRVCRRCAVVSTRPSCKALVAPVGSASEGVAGGCAGPTCTEIPFLLTPHC